MSIGLLGRKVGTTQIYDESGDLIPVTVVEAGPCVVLQCKTVERDGYGAVQLGYLDKPRRLASRSERGHVTDLGGGQAPKAGCEPKRFIREFRVEGDIPVAVGEELTVATLEDVAKVDVVARSKGRGTAGVMKRHNFRGQRASHGVKRVHRHPGSIGMSADPARVLKGTRMAGRHGAARVTVRNLKIVARDPELNLLMLKGSVPGPRGGYVTIRPAGK